MNSYYPHEFFKLDFDYILEEAKRQEQINSNNLGEFAKVQKIHEYFEQEVFPRIRANSDVFHATFLFINNYASDIMDVMNINGKLTYDTQKSLELINDEVCKYLAETAIQGKLKISVDEINLDKASDFYELIEESRLTLYELNKAKKLKLKASKQEKIQINVTLQSLAKIYEKALPQLMMVIKVVLKVSDNKSITLSDFDIKGLSEDITFYEKYIESQHPLFPIFGELRGFYKVARNVENHHTTFRWNSKTNIVELVDNTVNIQVHIHVLQQKYRLLVWLYELGFRGLLYIFCEVKKDETANLLVQEYLDMFPEKFPVNEQGILRFY